MPAKKIAITVNQESIRRNILHSFVLDALLRDPSVSIFLFVSEKEKERYQKEFSSSRISIIGHAPSVMFGDRVLRYLCRQGFRTETIMTDQETRFLADRNYLAFFLKRSLILVLGKSRLFHEFLRLFAKFRRAPAELLSLLKKLEINMLVATDVQDNLDIELMRAARELHIPIVGLVRSWDNLVSEGGLIQIIPHRLIVWSPYLYRQAVLLHHIPPARVVIAGIPHYDWYLKKELLEPREKFLSKIGLDPAKKTILFAGLGHHFAPHEAEAAEMIAEAFDSGELPDMQMLFRPHPAYDVLGKERLKNLPRTLFDAGVSPYVDREANRRKTEEEAIAHQLNSIYHADVLVTTPSSMIMDAVPFGKPAVGVGFDGKSQEPYWRSVRRYIERYTHIHDLFNLGAFPVAYDKAELIQFIREAAANPRAYEEGRKRILDEFIWKLDGKSGERFAKVILEAA